MGFSPEHARNILKLMAQISQSDPTFFAGRTVRAIKAALTYASYCYLSETSSLNNLRHRGRNAAWQGITQLTIAEKFGFANIHTVGKKSDAFQHLYHSIIERFQSLFPPIFGGQWNEQFLKDLLHVHTWVTNGFVYPETQTMNNVEFRVKHNLNWGDEKINSRRSLLKQQCSTCKQYRRHLPVLSIENQSSKSHLE